MANSKHAFLSRALVDNLARGLEDFRSSLTVEEAEKFSATDLQDLEVTIEAIQNRQRAKGIMQNTRRLERFLEVIESYSDFVAAHAWDRHLNNLFAFVWGPMKVLMEVASGMPDTFDALLDIYQEVAKTLPLVSEMEPLFEADPALGTVLAMFLQDIFVFHSRALKYFRGSAWKYMFQATWKLFYTRFAAELEQMRYRKTLVETQASMFAFQQARQMHLWTTADSTRQEQSEALLRKRFVIDWLAPADATVYQVSGREARQSSPGSGEWLLSRDVFRSWYHPLTAVAPLLWVTGMPGAGKTVLASLVIDEVPTITGAKVLFFYLREDDFERNSFVAMARSIIHQALQHEDGLLPYLYDQAAASADIHLRSPTVAETLLDRCLRALENTYIVIDGLDEAPHDEKRHIVRWMQRFVESSASESESCRCIFFSQDDQHTGPLLSGFPTLRIRPEDNQRDIQSYCLKKASDLSTKFSLQDSESSEIVTETVKRANGMFLFARIVMSNLYVQTNKQALYEELNPNNFPKDLREAYNRILARLNKAAPSERKQASRLIAWISCSTRVLKWQEIQCAISTDPDRDMVDYDRRKLVVDAKQLCGAIVEEMPNGDVCFVHSTVKEYMLTTQTVMESEQHILLASLCLSYLNLAYFEAQCSVQQIERELLKGSYAFFDYAVVSWAEHLMKGLSGLRNKNIDNIAGRLEEDLDTFFEQHWQSPDTKPTVPKRVLDCALSIQRTELREKAMLSMASLDAVMSMQTTDTSEIETLDLFRTLWCVREVLERLATAEPSRDTLAKYYPRRLFKCPRGYCKWFYEGFATKNEREGHRAKHDRSFRCPHRGCHLATLGCITEKDLETHIAAYHTCLPSENDFPDEPLESDIPAPTFSCPECKKPFTRAGNLNVHLRTHDEVNKTFFCQICQSSFARPADLKRHQDTHTSARSFVCHCGKTYKRADALARHKATAHDSEKSSLPDESFRPSTKRRTFSRDSHEAKYTSASANDRSTPSVLTQTPVKVIPRRLINAKSLQLEDFGSAHGSIPKYAILSHRWSAAEVTFDEYRSEEKEHKVGWAKIKGACKQAERDGHPYLWVDTCCINKSSSAELNEAINSMFAYYRDAEVCYVYLADVDTRGLCELPENEVLFTPGSREDLVFKDMQSSQWFTRGWTLQEMLAPSNVIFFSVDWKLIGRLDKIAPIIYAITKVDLAALRKEKTIRSYSFAQRLSWAAKRHTLRPEDQAYCLLGILDVSLEVKYGIGQAAFQELQRKLLESGTSDDSIFAWEGEYGPGPSSLFAPTPAYFRNAGDVICQRLMGSSFFYRSDGIAAKVYLYPNQGDLQGWEGEVALLNCTRGLGSDTLLGLHLESASGTSNHHAGLEYVVVALPGEHGTTSGRRMVFLDRGCIASATLREVTILLKTP